MSHVNTVSIRASGIFITYKGPSPDLGRSRPRPGERGSPSPSGGRLSRVRAARRPAEGDPCPTPVRAPPGSRRGQPLPDPAPIRARVTLIGAGRGPPADAGGEGPDDAGRGPPCSAGEGRPPTPGRGRLASVRRGNT
ncbi:hypothetical protein NL676_013340 [Syzygium grande]|nr:hypothetical protein NL676_013340 [Syzygium grande]